VFSLAASALQPRGESSLSSAARVAFCRRVLALIVCERDDWRTVSRIGRVQKATLAAEESEDSPSNGSVSTPSKRASSKKRARSELFLV
jgi:hypothetical protein